MLPHGTLGFWSSFLTAALVSRQALDVGRVLSSSIRDGRSLEVSALSQRVVRRVEKDHGAWSIPKGLISFGEAPLDTAKREFEEETGHRPRGEFTSLGEANQPRGKTAHVWAVEDGWNPDELKSNMFQME